MGSSKHESKNRATVPATDLEPNPCNAALSAHGFKTLASRVNIRVISYRKLNHDPDGISAKAVIDGIVRAGILTDDSSKQVESVNFKSYKTKKGEEEKTVIEIEEIN